MPSRSSKQISLFLKVFGAVVVKAPFRHPGKMLAIFMGDKAADLGQ
jgi:hypothetical protein